MVAIVEPHRWEAVPRRLRALGPAGGGHRPGHRAAGHRRPGGARRARRARRGGRPVARGDGLAPTRPRLSGHRVRPRVARPDAPPGVHRPPAPAEDPVDYLPLRGRIPGAVLGALSGRRTSRRADTVVVEQYDSNRPVEHRRRPGWRRRRCSGSRAPRRSSPRRTASPGRALDPWLGARCPCRGAPATWPSPAPGRWASPTASTSATRTRPRRIWQLAESRPRSRDACRALASRSPAATSRCTTSRPARDRAHTADRGGGLLDGHRRPGRAGLRARRRPVVLLGETGPGLAGSAYERLAGRGRGRPAVAGPGPRAALHEVFAGPPPASSRAARTCRRRVRGGRRRDGASGRAWGGLLRPGRRRQPSRCSARAQVGRRGPSNPAVAGARLLSPPGPVQALGDAGGDRLRVASRAWARPAPRRSAAAGRGRRVVWTCVSWLRSAAWAGSAPRGLAERAQGRGVRRVASWGCPPAPARRPRRSPRRRCSRSSIAARKSAGVAVTDGRGVMVYKDLGHG